MPPGTPRSRSFTRFTMRVVLPHLGQSVLLVVSMTFLRSAVFAIFPPTAMLISPDLSKFLRSTIRFVAGADEIFLKIDPDFRGSTREGCRCVLMHFRRN